MEGKRPALLSGNVEVAVRVRPLLEKEQQRGEELCLAVASSSKAVRLEKPPVVVGNTVLPSGGQSWAFDHIFNPDTTQEDVMETIGTPAVHHAFLGYHSCILAYGQTGSGKTYTMEGPDDGSAVTRGLIPRLCRKLFEDAENKKATPQAHGGTAGAVQYDYQAEVSHVEIYNEKVRCLLQPKSAEPRIREHPVTGPYVDGATKCSVHSADEIQKLLKRASRARTVAATRGNDRSSRSHALFIVTFTQIEALQDGSNLEKESRITLVDLAGSERVWATDTTSKEGANINRSLTALGNVINLLSERETASLNSSQAASSPRHVPYRDSALTWILRESLGGNSKTNLICTLSPTMSSYDLTLSTLRFAERAKCLVTRPVVNEDPSKRKIRLLVEEVESLKSQLERRDSSPIPATLSPPGTPTTETYDMLSTERRLRESETVLEGLKEEWEARVSQFASLQYTQVADLSNTVEKQHSLGTKLQELVGSLQTMHSRNTEETSRNSRQSMELHSIRQALEEVKNLVTAKPSQGDVNEPAAESVASAPISSLPEALTPPVVSVAALHLLQQASNAARLPMAEIDVNDTFPQAQADGPYLHRNPYATHSAEYRSFTGNQPALPQLLPINPAHATASNMSPSHGAAELPSRTVFHGNSSEHYSPTPAFGRMLPPRSTERDAREDSRAQSPYAEVLQQVIARRNTPADAGTGMGIPVSDLTLIRALDNADGELSRAHSPALGTDVSVRRYAPSTERSRAASLQSSQLPTTTRAPSGGGGWRLVLSALIDRFSTIDDGFSEMSTLAGTLDPALFQDFMQRAGLGHLTSPFLASFARGQHGHVEIRLPDLRAALLPQEPSHPPSLVVGNSGSSGLRQPALGGLPTSVLRRRECSPENTFSDSVSSSAAPRQPLNSPVTPSSQLQVPVASLTAPSNSDTMPQHVSNGVRQAKEAASQQATRPDHETHDLVALARENAILRDQQNELKHDVQLLSQALHAMQHGAPATVDGIAVAAANAGDASSPRHSRGYLTSPQPPMDPSERLVSEGAEPRLSVGGCAEHDAVIEELRETVARLQRESLRSQEDFASRVDDREFAALGDSLKVTEQLALSRQATIEDMASRLEQNAKREDETRTRLTTELAVSQKEANDLRLQLYRRTQQRDNLQKEQQRWEADIAAARREISRLQREAQRETSLAQNLAEADEKLQRLRGDNARLVAENKNQARLLRHREAKQERDKELETERHEQVKMSMAEAAATEVERLRRELSDLTQICSSQQNMITELEKELKESKQTVKVVKEVGDNAITTLSETLQVTLQRLEVHEANESKVAATHEELAALQRKNTSMSDMIETLERVVQQQTNALAEKERQLMQAQSPPAHENDAALGDTPSNSGSPSRWRQWLNSEDDGTSPVLNRSQISPPRVRP